MEITVKIAGTDYKLKVDSPESEQVTRRAAAEINTMLAKYDSKFMDRSLTDKLVFVSLLETKAKMIYSQRLQDVGVEIEQLRQETDNYLAGSVKD